MAPGQPTLPSGTSWTIRAAGRTDGIGVTVGQVLDRWLEECERLDLSPATVRNHRSQVNGTIRPRLGKLELHQLNPKHLDALYGTLLDVGKSPETIRTHAIRSAALRQAGRWGWLRESIAERAKPPRVSNRRVTASAVEVGQQVIEEAERRDRREEHRDRPLPEGRARPRRHRTPHGTPQARRGMDHRSRRNPR